MLSVLNGLGYPDEGAGTNDQGLCMFCEGDDCGADHPPRRPVPRRQPRLRRSPGRARPSASSAPTTSAWSPGRAKACKPVGYGYDSIEAIVEAAMRVNAAGAGLAESDALAQAAGGVRARSTAAASWPRRPTASINELVVEAARMSILHDGRYVAISDQPS